VPFTNARDLRITIRRKNRVGEKRDQNARLMGVSRMEIIQQEVFSRQSGTRSKLK
jgi:hypothetical protein